jgi:hypothetical protein
MLQIHSYAQLAHWAVVALTTDRCEMDQASQGPFFMCLFEPVYFRKGKKII